MLHSLSHYRYIYVCVHIYVCVYVRYFHAMHDVLVTSVPHV